MIHDDFYAGKQVAALQVRTYLSIPQQVTISRGAPKASKP